MDNNHPNSEPNPPPQPPTADSSESPTQSQSSATNEVRLHGKMAWFNLERGYGFVDADDGQRYYTDTRGLEPHSRPPYAGLPVEFTLVPTRQGPHARQLMVLDADPALPPPPIHFFVEAVARRLGESERTPLTQIRSLIEELGFDRVWALVLQTEEIEAQGGMLLHDNSRRRTKGGVFFWIARAAIDPIKRHIIFPSQAWTRSFLRRKAMRILTQPYPPLPEEAKTPEPRPVPEPFQWGMRGKFIDEARSAPGEIRTVKVTLIGRPNKVVERQNFTLLMMRHRGPLPNLPRGLPKVDPVPETMYVVYIGSRQWRQVNEAIRNPDDVLIIEGVQVWDAEYQAITVFAINATTKILQNIRRQQQREASSTGNPIE